MDGNADLKRLEGAITNLANTVAAIINERMQQATSEQARHPAEPFITKQQLAQHFNVSARTIENWRRRGVLPYVKVGKVLRFKLSEVESYWSEHFTVRRWGRRR